MKDSWSSRPSRSHSWSQMAAQVGVSAAVGAGVVVIMSLASSGSLQARASAAGAFIGVAIWASCFALACLFETAIDRASSPWRQLLWGVVFAAGGAGGWMIAVTVSPLLFGVRFGAAPRQAMIPILITSSLAVVVGTVFTIIEQLRLRLEASIEATKAGEYAERELEVAAAIQRRLLPGPQVVLPGLTVTARHLPARLVAGDFYDVFRLSDDRIAVVVADVAGKGMGASLIMASAKAMVPLIATGQGIAAAMGDLNDRLCGELDQRQFVALAMIWIHPDSGAFEVANAGLPDPYLLLAGTPPVALAVPGPRLPLGIRPGLEYRVLEGTLGPSCRLLMLTDGAPEALGVDGQPLGYARFESGLRFDGHDTASWLDARLDALRLGHDADDDWTLVVVERTPPVVAEER